MKHLAKRQMFSALRGLCQLSVECDIHLMIEAAVSREDIVETTFPVRYAESDQMGIVHHASYVIWMEEGRTQYLRAKGLGYEQVERAGTFLAVAEMNLRYIAPARYGDTVTVRTWIDDLRSRTVTFGYEIVNAASRAKLATGQVKLIWIDREGRVTKMPESVRALVGLLHASRS